LSNTYEVRLAAEAAERGPGNWRTTWRPSTPGTAIGRFVPAGGDRLGRGPSLASPKRHHHQRGCHQPSGRVPSVAPITDRPAAESPFNRPGAASGGRTTVSTRKRPCPTLTSMSMLTVGHATRPRRGLNTQPLAVHRGPVRKEVRPRLRRRDAARRWRAGTGGRPGEEPRTVQRLSPNWMTATATAAWSRRRWSSSSASTPAKIEARATGRRRFTRPCRTSCLARSRPGVRVVP